MQHSKAGLQHGATWVHKTQDEGSEKPKRLQSIPLLSWLLISGYLFERSSKFSHYTIFFLYPLKPNRSCYLKGFSFLLVFFILHKNFLSPECKQCALLLDCKTFAMIWIAFYLSNKEVNIYGAENIFPYSQMNWHGITSKRAKYLPWYH